MIKELTIRIPGSTANLGPGFDALALAVNLYCTLTFKVLDEKNSVTPLITLEGDLAGRLPVDETNMVYNVFAKILNCEPTTRQNLRLTIASNIPLSRGLGSSAAATIGAVRAAFAFNNDSSLDAMLAHATALEGHPDNVAASLFGGLVISSQSDDAKQVVSRRMKWPHNWCPIAVVPPYTLSTKESRSVLPQTISRQDAVANVQNVALLLAAVNNEDPEAMRLALRDRLHEPYRQTLVPELPALRTLLADLPVLGCVLSGAGPSVLVLVEQKHQEQTLSCLKEWASKQDRVPAILDLQVDQEGLRVEQK